MAQTVEIKTNDPRFAIGLSEGANAVALRTIEAENRHLRAVYGVRREADEKRWKRTQKRLERKYGTPEHGRLYGAFWGCVGAVVLGVYEWYDWLSAWNRR